jgi:hypothetical protein
MVFYSSEDEAYTITDLKAKANASGLTVPAAYYDPDDWAGNTWSGLHPVWPANSNMVNFDPSLGNSRAYTPADKADCYTAADTGMLPLPYIEYIDLETAKSNLQAVIARANDVVAHAVYYTTETIGATNSDALRAALASANAAITGMDMATINNALAVLAAAYNSVASKPFE